ncbi:MAG TPA: hypothetical protein VFU21_08385 [Kofleriaceae bacterium]|nr:hypothetical protein [Kofleriaceae bacterium]
MTAAFLWIAGAAALLVWAARARAAARARGGEASRTAPILAAAAVIALAAGAALAFAVLPAGSDGERSPARSRLFLHSVELPVPAKGEELRIGWSPNAGLRLPPASQPDEALRAWNLLVAKREGAAGARLTAVEPPETTATGLVLQPLAAGDDLAGAADRAAAGCAGAGRDPAPLALVPGARGLALVCHRGAPTLAFGLAAVRAGDKGEPHLRVAPLVRRAGRFQPPQMDVGTGALIQIGSSAEAAPGIEVWEVPSPPGGTRLLVTPQGLAGCGEWRQAIVAASAQPAAVQPDDASVCVLGFAAPYAMEVRRLVADTGAVALWSFWAAGLLALPALAWLLWLAAARRSSITRARLADALAFAWVAVVFAAIAGWRLLWAHRIDMLRDYQAAGWRVEHNLYWIGLCAAALAGTAAARVEPHLPAARRIALAAGAWLLAMGLTAAAADLPAGGRDLALALVSLAIGVGPIALARRVPRSGPLVLLLALAGAALVAPPSPGIKMAIGWAIVIAFYSAARTRPTAALLAGGLAAGAALTLDAGITAALVLPGMVGGLLFAARDACFQGGDHDASAHRVLGLPLAAAHAALALLVAGTLCVWALAAAGPEPGLWLTGAALHLPLVVAACLAPAAALVWRRHGAIAARPWAVAAIVAASIWVLRAPLLDAVLESDSQAAHRIAQVVDPGYALLRSPDRFLAGLTAWRETAVPPAGDAWSGQGLFGAQLLDPGVLLSVENDYLPVLVLRETGLAGILATALLLGGLAAGLWLLAGARFRRGDGAGRVRSLAALVIGGLVLYQPLAALGALPLTGLPWPGLGLDGASDLLVLLAVTLWCASWGVAPGPLDVVDAGLRRERRYARVRRLELAAAATAVAASLLVLTRAGIAAVSRPAVPAGADRALAYARALGCGGDALPERISGRPIDDGTERFHRALDAGWLRARPSTAARVATLAGSQTCAGDDAPDECTVRVPLGLPEVEVRVAGGAPRCAVVLPDETLRMLHLPPARPFRGQRVRLVSRAMGAATRDVGELVSGSLVVRLRPDAAALRLDPPPSEPAGLFAAGKVELGGGAVLRAGDDGVQLEDPASAVLLLTRGEDGRWQRGGGAAALLERLALVVVGGASSSRAVWLFRPRSRWPLDESGPAVVDPLLADDVGGTGSGRRAYVYGGLIPELGWVNRYRSRSSLGLDGWVRVALDERSTAGPLAGPPRCGPLDPPPGDLQEVCAVAEDGAVECRVAVQPELAVRLRHLIELASLLPARFAPRTAGAGRAPVAGSFALLRGDSGEIIAQGEFVPGRASSLYAPASPAVERQLIRAREDRDVATGARLPPALRGEASGEKIGWNQPLAVGSAMKPLVARAFERTAPTLARQVLLRGAPFAGATCRGGKAHAILGHCPPTDSLWNHRQEMGLDGFLARSANWYMAALGLIGTALPDGKVGLGPAEVPIGELLARDVGDHAPDAALWTERDGRRVVSDRHTIDLAALREAPMWKNLEAVWGRPLCLLGDKATCRRAAERADLCAARALPIAEPTADLRHLVALGPGGFDFHPTKGGGEKVATFEYLQFLRGSGVHALGSLLQLTDAFNRIAFEEAPGPKGYRLAASWFPVPAVAGAPRTDCGRTPYTGDPVRDGLCEVVRSGTASRALAGLLSDPGVVIYGAKTGTIDSLADIAERPAACARFNQAHTRPDRPARADQQPYWLDCGARATTPDDSLLLVSFGVPTQRGGMVPLTLGIRFQRAGAGFASEVAPHFVAVIRDYFAAGQRRLP